MAEGSSSIQGIGKVVHISSNITMSCPVCTRFRVGGDNWQEGVNHFLETHDWRLLYVGGEHAMDDRGASITFTVAVVGQP
jgi:hypothetical protein